MKLLCDLWLDETGFLISAELVLVATILVIGCIAGMSAIRDAVCSEMTDVANAMNNINQSYSYSGVRTASAWTAGSNFQNIPRTTQVYYDDNATCIHVASYH